MLKLPRQSDLADLPFARVITTVYLILLPLLIPVGFVLLACMLAAQMKGLRSAVDPYEKVYWRLNVAGYLLVVYAAVVLGLLMADGMRGEPWALSAWWPSIAGIWYGANNRTIAILADLLMVLVAGFSLICSARYFGDIDENGMWREPDWLIREYRIDDLSAEQEALLDMDQSFATKRE